MEFLQTFWAEYNDADGVGATARETVDGRIRPAASLPE